jgi:alpha-1,2-mannosyltransferase
MRHRARASAKRFTEEEFAKGWIYQMEKLIQLRQLRTQ